MFFHRRHALKKASTASDLPGRSAASRTFGHLDKRPKLSSLFDTISPSLVGDMTSRLRGRDAPIGRNTAEQLPQAGDNTPTPAQLNLTRLFEQNQPRQQKNMAAKASENPPDGMPKGKPRLLLMGQRRYDCIGLGARERVN